MTKLLLCTDLDRTLIPNGPQPESTMARDYFNKLVSRDDVSLVYVTGRDKSLVLDAIDQFQLPLPDFVIADVGASIYLVKGEQWKEQEQWDEEIASDWNGKTNQDIRLLLESYQSIRLQEEERQKNYKLSYYVPLHINQVLLLKEIDICLKDEKIKSNLIWSVDEQVDLGLLDILPVSANKKHAIKFLMTRYDFKLSETVFVGDSGNDISVMASPIRSILVANATDEIKRTAVAKARINNQDNSLYLAKGDFYGMNGNYCAGILEGVVHYMPVVKDWLELNDG